MFQTDDTVNDTVNGILALIKRNPSITYDELTEKKTMLRKYIPEELIKG